MKESKMSTTGKKAARVEPPPARHPHDKVASGEVSAATFLGLVPKDCRQLLGFAMAMAEQGDLETAEAAAEVAASADPHSFDAWMVLGATRARKREALKALEAYARAASIDGSSPRLWCDVGELKLSLYDYEGAAKALALAIEHDSQATTPGGTRARALVAKAYAQLDKASGR